MSKEEWFGVVRWCEDDLKNALEIHSVSATEKNINKLRKICEHHSFTDMMIERGWEYIYAIILQNDWRELYKCNICGEILEIEDGDDWEEILWGHIQMKHDDIFDEIKDWDTPVMFEKYYTDQR